MAGKKVTSIYMKDEVRIFCDKHNINFSEWANDTFTEQFLSLGSKVRQLENITKQAQELQEQIKTIRDKQATLLKTLSSDQKIFLKSVPLWIEDGKDICAVRTRFNKQFAVKYNQDEFLTMIEAVNNDY